jgi:hypothetical protein
MENEIKPIKMNKINIENNYMDIDTYNIRLIQKMRELDIYYILKQLDIIYVNEWLNTNKISLIESKEILEYCILFINCFLDEYLINNPFKKYEFNKTLYNKINNIDDNFNIKDYDITKEANKYYGLDNEDITSLFFKPIQKKIINNVIKNNKNNLFEFNNIETFVNNFIEDIDKTKRFYKLLENELIIIQNRISVENKKSYKKNKSSDNPIQKIFCKCDKTEIENLFKKLIQNKYLNDDSLNQIDEHFGFNKEDLKYNIQTKKINWIKKDTNTHFKYLFDKLNDNGIMLFKNIINKILSNHFLLYNQEYDNIGINKIKIYENIDEIDKIINNVFSNQSSKKLINLQRN